MESLSLNRELGTREQLFWNLCILGSLAKRQGDAQEAMARLAESLVGFREIGQRIGIAACLESMAGVAGATGRPMRAVRLFGAAAAIRDRIGHPPYPEEQIEYARRWGEVRAQLDTETFAAAWAAGQAMTIEQAIAEALRVRAGAPT